MKQINISDAAYNLVSAHAYANRETIADAMDELFAVAPHAWEMAMPEMKEPWETFKKYRREIK